MTRRTMSNPRVFWILLGALTALGTRADAHHGRGTRYDMDSEIELQGTVRELVWRNPHIAILIDVPGEEAGPTTWVIEHSNVSTLARLGYQYTESRAARHRVRQSGLSR